MQIGVTKAPVSWAAYSPGCTESTSKCQLAMAMVAHAYEVPVLPVGPPEMKGRIGTSRTKCAKTTRILCGAPHFMGFVLVCPAAENQGEISDEMNEGDEADET